MQTVAVGEPFDGDDLVPFGLRGEDEARAHERAVEQHRARAALALLAGVLRAVEAEALAQRVEQALALPDVRLAPLAVDGQLELHRVRHLSSARAASTRSAWRRYGAGAAHVVDRARRRGDLLGKGVGVVQRGGDERRHGTGRAEGGREHAALAIDAECERDDGDHHRVARPDLHEGLRAGARRGRGRRRSARPPRARSASGRRGRTRARGAARRARSRPPPRSSEIRSGGSASPAGEAVPRLPPIVPRLRICGEPTVREASASAGQERGELRTHRVAVGEAGAEPNAAVLARPALRARRPRSG